MRYVLFVSMSLSVVAGRSMAQVPGYTADQRVSPPGLNQYRWPAIAVDQHGVSHVAWMGWTSIPGPSRVLYTQLTADGVPRMAPIVMTTGTEPAERPDLAIDEFGDVHMVWHERQVGIEFQPFYAKLDGNGATLLAPRRLTVGWDWAPCEVPRIACDQRGGVHIVWADSRPIWSTSAREIVYERHDLVGNVLLDDTRLTLHASSVVMSGFRIAMLADQTGLDVAWQIRAGSLESIMLGRFGHDGQVVRAPMALTTTAIVGYPDMARDRGGDLHVVLPTLHVHYARLAPNGTFRVPLTQVDSNPDHTAGTATVAPLRNGALVIWSDGRPQGSGPTALFGALLRADGIRVSEHLVSGMTGDSLWPTATTDAEDHVRLVWMSQCEGCGLDLHLFAKRTSGPLLQTADPPRLGGNMTFQLEDALRPSQHFVFALAFGTTPGIALGDGRVFPLADDWLLLACFDPTQAPAVGLTGNHGDLDSAGRRTVNWSVPGIPALVGVEVFAAYATFTAALPVPAGVLSLSPAMRLTLTL
ncbi:MAG: hypothetical protein IPK26_22850 [Planctomycetes bacterium]|nr:hypothetical protein [Planctomycetota bacterium]